MHLIKQSEILRTKNFPKLVDHISIELKMSDPLLQMCFLKWCSTSQREHRYVNKISQRNYEVYGIGNAAGEVYM